MPKALISVYNKEGIANFAKELESLGWEIISTGGTFEALKKAGLKNLKKVEELTGFPEMMDGRVKTLQAKIYGGILADRSKPVHLQEAKKHQIQLINLVVCNLYPFSETVSKADVTGAEAIENIDIGGVTLIRAAAKNYQYVTVVTDLEDYQEVLKKLKAKEDLVDFNRKLAQQAFNYTARYDEAIANYFSGRKNLDLHFQKIQDLRYGENPHQSASYYRELKASNAAAVTIIGAEVLHGKELSYNNILDAESAIDLIKEFKEPAAAVIKHTNPCGCALGKNINEAFDKAYQADSLSAFGGIIILNRACTEKIAQEINKVFAEMVIAPDYAQEAKTVLKQKKNIRLVKLPSLQEAGQEPEISLEYRFLNGGLLVQEKDTLQLQENDLKLVTKTKPQNQELTDLLFAWKVIKHLKSNSVILVKNGCTVGIGTGQMSRVDSVDIAIFKAGQKAKGSYCASDGFFPFRDSIDKLAQVGVKSIIQPGGSLKDQEVIKACDELGMSMVFTGKRAFRH